MKKGLTTLLFIGTVNLLLAQSYFNFPDTNTVWTYLQCDYIPTNPIASESCHTQYYTLSGDTVINGLDYNKMYHGTVPNQLGNFYAAVREDSLKKVYAILIPGDTTEYVKFNFSGSVGDTMGTDQTIVTIDSVLISGSYHDRFILSSNDTIIEGIGNINNVIVPLFSPDGVRSILLCMTTNNNLIYQNPQYQTCDTAFSIVLSVNNLNDSDKHFKIYPNPVKAQIIIEFDATGSNNTLIEIKNVLGETVYSKSIKTTGNIQFENIDLINLSKGTYLVQLKSESKVVSKKFVKL